MDMVSDNSVVHTIFNKESNTITLGEVDVSTNEDKHFGTPSVRFQKTLESYWDRSDLHDEELESDLWVV